VAVKVSLTERISIEAGEVVVDEQRFPGRQGRLVFAYLLSAGGRPVPKDELAAALWGHEPPAKWDKALSVLVSKLRALLNECGLDGPFALTSAFGCYKVTLPADSWIDVAAADEAASAAEKALAGADLAAAMDNAATAATLARRTFLPGEDGHWIDEKRAELRAVLARALECLAEANRMTGDAAASGRVAEELVVLEPFRERGYRLLMQAQSAGGNDAEALRTYERCRTLLAEELGAFPSPETEAVYLEILRSRREPAVPPPMIPEPAPASEPPSTESPPRGRRRFRIALVAAVAAVLAIGVGAALALTRGDAVPVEVLPNSVVRIDPSTLEPRQVVPVGASPDFVVAAGGYVWTTHWILRAPDSGAYFESDLVRDAGDRTVTRVDPTTGEAQIVGGLSPCGLAPDPSGDIWVANCLAHGSTASVVRIDAKTLAFDATWPVPNKAGYFRGLAYGGGWLWLADTSGALDYRGILRIDPNSGASKPIPLPIHAGDLAWAEGYGDLWTNDFVRGSLVRIHPASGIIKRVDGVGTNPADVVVDGNDVWVADWGAPQVVRLDAVGSGAPEPIALPVAYSSSVWTVAAGAGAIWATTPQDRALWRIDPETNDTTRIPLGYSPGGVTVADDGVWVTVRGP
jgi:DNA-binding SARP family transcriptional activator/streptogramin lyase